MSEQQLRVIFQPSGRNVFVLPGTKIVEAAGRAGININMPCGGQGTCGKCRIQITSEEKTIPCQIEEDIFSREELKMGWRLACQTSVQNNMTVYIPDESLIIASQKILTKGRGIEKIQTRPAISKKYVELTEPTREDNKPDVERLSRQIGEHKLGLEQLRKLPKFLRENEFKATAVLADHMLIGLEQGNTANQCYGAAFDIGTSTIVGSLMDLCNGSEIAVTSGINPQVSYGDDILSRIEHASSCDDCLDQLRIQVITTINKMIESMCQGKSIHREQVYELVIAGNTTMEHLLCGIDPSSLGKVPFVPVHSKGMMFSASELGISINHRGLAYLFPIIGGFVGGDITAGILVTELACEKPPYLLVDVGTNGEIAIVKDEKIWAASTAAGPAFEGARISCGMRATHGAIEKVIFGDDLHCSTIGNATPVGICGSGLIDLAAELLKNGLLSTHGQLLPEDQVPARLSDAIKRRIRKSENGQISFLVYEQNNGRKDLKVVLSQKDIRELQLAVGAIRAGIEIMLRKTDTKVEDLENIFIAGGFGSFIRRANAQRIGLIPRDVSHNKISFIGNSSLEGAQLALLSTNARHRAEEIAKAVNHIQLSLDMDFQAEFANAMIFPEYQNN
ncbi:Na(+)-translocating NADH-quinone reductase subunit F [Limihaloglobus sulfuriphilus]|uniref:Na(+)-translocating NADH-quinone reductase subunit F n=1 Tax=Limihaloglobus sulfuriphilus TaxID=1851148 RepID=A0A1R7T5U8_9BACT|nr:ASKHA domain-containing protein [Limihaloglobus sulfuriphilus]AQQ71806.1 Na(+)-translocating NADH-quinone reductase subunit F [Limihaloglobus sulfuriphilus]